MEPPWRRYGGAAADFLASGVLAPARLGHKASKRREARRLKARGYEPILTGTRFCLLKRPENLTESQEVKLVELLKYNLRAVRAYLLKEDFQLFCDYVSPPWLASSWTAGAPGRCDPSSTP